MAFTDEETKGMTIEEVQQEYFDRSEKANEVGNQVVWMLLIVLAALFVSGHVYREILWSGGFAVLAIWLGVMQRLWQAWTVWLFKRKMECLKVYNPHDYPRHIRNGAWILYWLKMVALTAAVGCFIYGAFA